MPDSSTEILKDLIKEINGLKNFKDSHQEHIEEVVSHLYKIAWRSSELIPGVRFKIRDIICERDWDYLEYLKVILNEPSKKTELESNLSEVIEELSSFGETLERVVSNNILNRKEKSKAINFNTCLPKVYSLSSKYLDILYLSQIEKTSSILLTSFDINNKFHRKSVLRTLEIIGEYSKKISKSTKDKFPGIPWSSDENEGGILGLFRNITEHPDSLQKEMIDKLSDNPEPTDDGIKQIYDDLIQFHNRIQSYIAHEGVETEYVPIGIIKIYNTLNDLGKKKVSLPKTIKKDKTELDEVKNLFKECLSKIGASNAQFLTFFETGVTEEKIITFLTSKGFEVVEDSEMRVRNGSNLIAKSLLSKVDKLFLKVIGESYPQIRKIFSNQGVDSIIDLKKEVCAFLSLEEAEAVFAALEPYIIITTIAVVNLYRTLANNDKIDELIAIIEKKQKISSLAELRSKIKDILPDEPGKEEKVDKILVQLCSSVEIVSYTDKAIREINELISTIELTISRGEITSYEQLLNPNSIYYLSIQLIIEQVGLVAKDSKLNDAGIEFKVSTGPETISPRRMLIIRIFRDLIAHYPERIDSNLAEIFLRDLVAFTKSDIRERQEDIKEGVNIWLCQLEQPDPTRELTLETLEKNSTRIFAIIRNFGFKSSIKVFGRIIGSEIGPRAGLDIIVEYNDGITPNPLSLLELELALGSLLNIHARVHTLETLQKNVGSEFRAADLLAIKQQSKQLGEIIKELEFKRQFLRGNVISFILSDGTIISQGNPLFTAENAAKAFNMTVLPNDEERHINNEQSRKTRERQIKDPRVLGIIRKKAEYLAKEMAIRFASIEDSALRKLFLELIKIDKDLDLIIDEYCSKNRDGITAFFESKGGKLDKATTRYNFRDYAKRSLAKDLPTDLVAKIKPKMQEKIKKIFAIKDKINGSDIMVDDWTFKDMTEEFHLSTEENTLIVRNNTGTYKVNDFPRNLPAGTFEVLVFKTPFLRTYKAYVIFRDLKLYFDEIDGNDVVQALIDEQEEKSTHEHTIDVLNQALVNKFMDLDDFIISFENNRTAEKLHRSKNPFHSEVMDEVSPRLMSNPIEQLKERGYELIASLVDCECLNKISQLKAFVEKPGVTGSMTEVEMIKIEDLSTFTGSKCDKTSLINPTAMVILDPTITDLDEVARIFKVKGHLDRYPGGRAAYAIDKGNFREYKEFKRDLNILENIIININFLEKKNNDINARLADVTLDEGTLHVLLIELNKNKALTGILENIIHSYAELLVNSPFFQKKLEEELGSKKKSQLLATDNYQDTLRKLLLGMVRRNLSDRGKEISEESLSLNHRDEGMPALEYIVTEECLTTLIDATVAIDYTVIINEELQKENLRKHRKKAIYDAVKKEELKTDGERLVVTNLAHIQTIADGNCAFNAVALGLLFHKRNGNDLFAGNEEFRKIFAEVFQIAPETFSQEAFSQLVEALISPNINLANPLIRKIIEKLENVGEVHIGSVTNQLEQRMSLLRNTAIQDTAYEEGNIKPQYRAIAIRCLAERGELFQMAMAIALRRYCVKNNGANIIFTLTDGKVFTDKLNTPNVFGAYVGSDELNFLANRFGLHINEKQGEFGGWAKYGDSSKVINVFCTTPGTVDCHYELLLKPSAEFLGDRLTMGQSLTYTNESTTHLLDLSSHKANAAFRARINLLEFLKKRSPGAWSVAEAISLGQPLTKEQQEILIYAMHDWSKSLFEPYQNLINLRQRTGQLVLYGRQFNDQDVITLFSLEQAAVRGCIDRLVLPLLGRNTQARLVTVLSDSFSNYAKQLMAPTPSLEIVPVQTNETRSWRKLIEESKRKQIQDNIRCM